MPTFSLNTIATSFFTASSTYSHTLQPYAIKLFFGLLLIDILITYLQYTADQLDPMHYLGRTIRHMLGGGFVYIILLHGFDWMWLVIQSFGRLGAIITGLPALDPQSILVAGLNLATTLWNSPTNTGLIASIELGILQGFMAVVVLAAFSLVAIELLLTLVKGYMTIGVGIMMLSFGGTRFTANVSESYFTSVIKVGVKILFIYAVLGIGMKITNDFETALLAACKPVSTTLPWIASFSTPPTAMATTICTGTITLSDMAYYAVMSAVFAALCIAIPRMAAELVGGPLGHALEDMAAAYYISRAITSPISNALSAAGKSMRGAASDFVNGAARPSQSDGQSFAANVAAQARAQNGTQPTAPLNPFNGQPPGHNMRGPAGPALPPSPNGGSGAAQLMYIPGKPGAKTRAEAIDITKLQKKR